MGKQLEFVAKTHFLWEEKNNKFKSCLRSFILYQNLSYHWRLNIPLHHSTSSYTLIEKAPSSIQFRFSTHPLIFVQISYKLLKFWVLMGGRIYSGRFLKKSRNIQGGPRNMTVGEWFKMSSSIIFQVVWYCMNRTTKILYGSHIISKLISKYNIFE